MTPTGDRPTWDTFDSLIEHSGGLSPAGKEALRHLMARLRGRLVPSWPARQYDAFGGLPGELLMFATHRYVLPQLLAFALRFDAASDDPTFATVRTLAKKGLTVTDWYHLRLQLATAQAVTAMGHTASYEPHIPGTTHKADLLVNEPDGPWLVETTVVLRADVDKAWEAYEQQFQARLWDVESKYTVSCAAALLDHPDDMGEHGEHGDTTSQWLKAAEAAAGFAVATGQSQAIQTDFGWIAIYPGPLPDDVRPFIGAPQERDGWRRLGRTLAGKAKQIAGDLPVWVRVDSHDGMFQFTQWATMSPEDRIDALADVVRGMVAWPACAQGLVLSSGCAFAFGANDPIVEDVTVRVEAGWFVRRLIAPNLVRETFIIQIASTAAAQTDAWAHAYGSEPEWLDADLAAANLPTLAQFWVA